MDIKKDMEKESNWYLEEQNRLWIQHLDPITGKLDAREKPPKLPQETKCTCDKNAKDWIPRGGAKCILCDKWICSICTDINQGAAYIKSGFVCAACKELYLGNVLKYKRS
jgi:hypothetical protein